MNHHIQAVQKKTCSWQELSRCAKSLGCLPKACECNHEILGSGAVFFQSEGYLFCNNCRGIQMIRKPIK